MGGLASVAMGCLAVALVGIASISPLAAGVAAGVAALIVALTVLGTDRLGTLTMLAGFATAPMDDLRPSETSLATTSDLLIVGAALLLVPTVFQRRPHVSPIFIGGAIVVISMALISAALSTAPATSFQLNGRLVATVVVLPLFMAFWRPPLKVIDLLAWSYVLGQVISTAVAVSDGPLTGRYYGMTRHFNFFGLSAMIAAALLIHLYHRTPKKQHWIVWLAGAAVIYGLFLSGSRAATVVVIMLALLYPAIEKSAMSMYAVVAGGLTFVLSLERLVDYLGPGSALARLLPSDTTGASYSNIARQAAHEIAWDQFLERPLLGYGILDDQWEIHNVYLQLVVALGIFGLAGFLMLLWSLAKPLFTQGPMARLGYVALAYAAVAPLTPSIWDRNVWAALSLALLATVPYEDEAEPPDQPEPAQGTRSALLAREPKEAL